MKYLPAASSRESISDRYVDMNMTHDWHEQAGAGIKNLNEEVEKYSEDR